MSKRSGQALSLCTDQYFSLVDNASYLKAQVLPGELMDIRHESIIEDLVPCEGYLRFLG
jgi:hypothetical protein